MAATKGADFADQNSAYPLESVPSSF